MDYKKLKIERTAVTRKKDKFYERTGNIYETVAIISKRANQISVEIKHELDQKLEEFANPNDNLEEIFENREQIEIAKFYESMPKPTLIAVDEFLEDEIYVRKPELEEPK
jgi:DNA-directed RNA polymerase subunit K/omega